MRHFEFPGIQLDHRLLVVKVCQTLFDLLTEGSRAEKQLSSFSCWCPLIAWWWVTHRESNDGQSLPDSVRRSHRRVIHSTTWTVCDKDKDANRIIRPYEKFSVLEANDPEFTKHTSWFSVLILGSNRKENSKTVFLFDSFSAPFRNSLGCPPLEWLSSNCFRAAFSPCPTNDKRDVLLINDRRVDINGW